MTEFAAVELIMLKREKGELTTAQIDWLVANYTKGVVADEQMSAMAMAILLNGMSRREIRDLTMAMIASGETLNYDGLAWPTSDKHSTGGVGDKITLPLAPLVAAFGVAALTDDGRIVSGCNIENASYGLTLCAECSMVSELFMTGGGRLVAFTCVDGHGNILMPCGRCRQLLFEHSAKGMILETVSGFKTIDEVIPDAFGPRDLEERKND